jgi:hypothetical protein
MATQFLTVQYDAITLNPTPIVNYSSRPIDYGYVYGYNTDVTLEGLYTGISSYTGVITSITGVFGNQFKTLNVLDNLGNNLYSWPNITVDSISLDTNPYFSGSFVRYSVKLKSYNFPSGVSEPSNEYSFSQNEDSTVTVIHKISARGVRGSAGAFDNAVAFVKQFTGKDPFSNCAPFLVPSGSGVLSSLSENINRAEGIYSVTESYRYNTGVSAPYIKTTSLNVSDMIDTEYRTMDYSLKLQGSPVTKNGSTVINSLSGVSMLSDIQNEFGISTAGWVKNTFSANIDSGSATVDIQVGYVSGANLTGFFDYELRCEQDHLAGTENWRLEGEFKCFGPLDFKRSQLTSFRNVNGNGKEEWEPYVSGLIVNSPLYANVHRAGKMFSRNMKITVTENPPLAYLKISASAADGYEPLGLAELKSNWEVSPSKWIYQLMPSVNIEGLYVIQDIQTKTQTRQKMAITSKTHDQQSGASLVSGYLTTWATSAVSSGNPAAITAFLVDESFTTGTFEVNASQTWLGADSGLSSGILALQSIGTNGDSFITRPEGYNFGY